MPQPMSTPTAFGHTYFSLAKTDPIYAHNTTKFALSTTTVCETQLEDIEQEYK